MNRITQNLFAMQKIAVVTLCIVCTLFFALSGCNADLNPLNEDNSKEFEATLTQNVMDDHPYYFYNHEGEKEYLTLNTEYAFFSVKEQQLPDDILQRNFRTTELMSDRADLREYQTKRTTSRFYTEFRFEEKLTDEQYLKLLSDIRRQNKGAIIAPYFKTTDNKKIGMSNFFYVTLKAERDTTILRQMAERTGSFIVEQDPLMPICFVLSITDTSELNALECSNLFYESRQFHAAGPDLMVDPRACANDPQFSQQWGLRNLDMHPSFYRLDMKICDAWQISTGNNILVAVIDDGIYSHTDLSANIHPTLRFDCDTRNTTQQVLRDGSHGTKCAGVLGAVRNNNTGIAGVAPNCRIIPISSSLSIQPLTIQDLAWGINQAWQNGADVINCSWGSATYSSGGFIENAINNAVTQGRLRSNGNRLGSVVVAASGNFYASSVIFPASLSNVIAVGASTSSGFRADFSHYGTALDVVAPGVDIRTTSQTNGYISDLGTSFAAPAVAGVAALLLSYNPNLTQAQVRAAIESSCIKLSSYTFNTSRPNSTWNNHVGYGLVNAVGALAASQGRYAVSFDLMDGGAGAVPAAQFVTPNSYATSPTPSRAGYTFGGWYRNSDGTGAPINLNTSNIQYHQTFFAKWLTPVINTSGFNYRIVNYSSYDLEGVGVELLGKIGSANSNGLLLSIDPGSIGHITMGSGDNLFLQGGIGLSDLTLNFYASIPVPNARVIIWKSIDNSLSNSKSMSTHIGMSGNTISTNLGHSFMPYSGRRTVYIEILDGM